MPVGMSGLPVNFELDGTVILNMNIRIEEGNVIVSHDFTSKCVDVDDSSKKEVS